ncbi:hypothetical protein RE432_18505 [Pusillimonas sp. SM2304]|uniref:hypothetical protein n=1 Tax=Pusillimonas sp. SM2304 TaxID=3073241 RepID=UPI002874604B|nr:hypothetical protein [Pusillimonas sp. SM2304]MDS1142430.1 hypothetical protein [Pusillimonas sp. SM2304]
MDGKWKWPLVLLLFICSLPKMLWYKLFPPKPSPMEERLHAQQKQALEQRRLDNMPWTEQEEEEFDLIERRMRNENNR